MIENSEHKDSKSFSSINSNLPEVEREHKPWQEDHTSFVIMTDLLRSQPVNAAI